MRVYNFARKVRDGYKGVSSLIERITGRYITSSTHFMVRDTRKEALEDAAEIEKVLLKELEE